MKRSKPKKMADYALKPLSLAIGNAVLLALTVGYGSKVLGDLRSPEKSLKPAPKMAYEIIDRNGIKDLDNLDNLVIEKIERLKEHKEHGKGEHGERPAQEKILQERAAKHQYPELYSAVQKNLNTILTGTYTENTWKYDSRGNKVPAKRSFPIMDKVRIGLEASLDYRDFAQESSEIYGVPEDLILAVIAVETGGNDSESRAGAKGVMQLMKGTANQYGCAVDDKKGIDERDDPKKCIDCGTKYLGKLMDDYNGNVMLALAAYNWGPGNLNRVLRRIGADEEPAKTDWNSIRSMLPGETRAYVKRVLSREILLRDYSTEMAFNSMK